MAQGSQGEVSRVAQGSQGEVSRVAQGSQGEVVWMRLVDLESPRLAQTEQIPCFRFESYDRQMRNQYRTP